MSVWPDSSAREAVLRGAEGELVSVRVSIEPRLLERVLDALARLEFPINPQIYHGLAATVVEFPAWAGRLGEVRGAFEHAGLASAVVSVRGMLENIRAVA
jgi:hypothetical protein